MLGLVGQEVAAKNLLMACHCVSQFSATEHIWASCKVTELVEGSLFLALCIASCSRERVTGLWAECLGVRVS